MCVLNGTRGCCARLKIQERYLYTIRNSLTGSLLATPDSFYGQGFNASLRLNGGDWPTYGLTLIGVRKLEYLHEVLHETYRSKLLVGDFLEAGAWRGGACIYAKAFFEAYGIERRVWVADSFAGLPGKQHDKDIEGWDRMEFLSVPLELVKDAFRRYALLDQSVRFVQGWFGQSLPRLRHELSKIAILRIDCDMYRSTLEVLCNLYDRVEVSGVWIVDDWGLSYQFDAINDFLHAGNIVDVPVVLPDGSASFEKLEGSHANLQWCQEELAPQKDELALVY